MPNPPHGGGPRAERAGAPTGRAGPLAFEGGDPIPARNWRAVVRRWGPVGGRKGVIPDRVATIAVAALVGMVGLAAYRLHAERGLGRVELNNDGPPLIAQVLPEAGDEPLGDPFDVVTRRTLALPAGDYRLRVHGVGRLGRTYRFAVNRGETLAHTLSLDEGRLLGREPSVPFGNQPKPREEPIPFAKDVVAVELTPGKADLIERTDRSLIRRDATTGKVVWEVTTPEGPRDSRREPDAWIKYLIATHPTTSLLALPASDLDGDGTADLVWSFRDLASFLAVSGKDGSALWDYAAALDGPGGPRADGPDLRPGPNSNQPSEPGARWGRVVGTPAAADADGDGTPDLIASMIFSESAEEIARRSGAGSNPNAAAQRVNALNRRVIVAVSGRSGRSLWSHAVDEAFSGLSPAAWSQPATVVLGRKSAAVALVDGTRWIGLDLATGRPRAAPIELGFGPVRPVQYADLDGDGEPEVLALGAGQAAGQLTLAAFSAATGREAWVEPVRAKYQAESDLQFPNEWPLVVDLDGDGRAEVAVPDSGALPPGDGYRGLRLLDGPTGRTRWVRPMRPETPGADGLIQVLDAPDLDGDGVRDLVASSFFLGRYPSSPNEGRPPVPERVYVDAISGRDGHPLWWWHRDHPTDKYIRVAPLRWWGLGPDGRPLLAVALGGPDPRSGNETLMTPPIVCNLEASTGRDVSTAVRLGKAGVADLDGDGLADLWGEAEGQLQAFRGEAPERWRALGKFGPTAGAFPWAGADALPAADLDGDGIADTLVADLRFSDRSPTDPIASLALEPALSRGFPGAGDPSRTPPSSRTALARSGRDGRLIWKAVLDGTRHLYGARGGGWYGLTTPPLPGGDLDGDGTADVIAQEYAYSGPPGGIEWKRAATLPLQALSGRTGRHLWSAGPLPLGFKAYGLSRVDAVRSLVIGPGEPPDLVVRHGSPFTPSAAAPTPGGSPTRPHLARVSGRTGRVVWDLALGETPDMLMGGSLPWTTPPAGFGDLDGDGALDAVLTLPGAPGPRGPGYDLRAVSLRDGRLLWSRRLDFEVSFTDSPELAVADLDGDKRAEVVVSERPDAGGRPVYALEALDGRDGQVRWSWRDAPRGPEQVQGGLFLADFEGDGRRSACLSFGGMVSDTKGLRRLVVFDPLGRVRADRDLSPGFENGGRSESYTHPNAVDLTGDGRDELVFFSGNRLHVWGPDLEERWSRPQEIGRIDQIAPAMAGRPAVLLAYPTVGLDGADGHPRWAGHAPHFQWPQFRPRLLDPGGPARLPLLVSQDLAATICREALPATAKGAKAPPRGGLTPPGLARDDPRWTRPLPWANLVDRDAGRLALLALVGLALVNAALPLVILRLAAGRRARSLRLVMALPAAATVPLIAFLTLEPSIPAPPAPFPSSPLALDFLGSLAGIPILAYPALAVGALIRRRWRALGLLAGLTAFASLAIGATWLLLDRRTMPSIEQYEWSGWTLAVAPGAYAASVLMLAGWAASGAIRVVAKRR